jgi:multidrug efflux pump subunit AcrB
MLRPLAIAVIGALCISVLLSLVATPVVYYILRTAQKTTSSSETAENI